MATGATNGQPPDDRSTTSTSDLRRAEIAEYQRQVDWLRANGCRCTLRFDGHRAVPLSAAEAIDCAVAHTIHEE